MDAAVDLEAQGHVGQRVDATGDRRDGVVGEPTVDAGERLDRVARRLDHAVALAEASSFSPSCVEHDGGRRVSSSCRRGCRATPAGSA